MKTQLLTLIVILSSTIVFCQETGDIADKIHITNETIIVGEFNIPEKQVYTTKYIAVKGTKFTIHDSIDEKLIIKFWNNTDSIKIKTMITTVIPEFSSGGPPPPPPVFATPPRPTTTTSTSFKDVSFNTNDKYFILDLEDYKKNTSQYKYHR